jgi:hypothetical protein
MDICVVQGRHKKSIFVCPTFLCTFYADRRVLLGQYLLGQYLFVYHVNMYRRFV